MNNERSELFIELEKLWHPEQIVLMYDARAGVEPPAGEQIIGGAAPERGAPVRRLGERNDVL